MLNNNNKFIASIILHALGDTIGFYNGKWEFFGINDIVKTKKINFNIANEILYEFISFGGINGINLKKWYVSDDTLLHMDVMEAFIEENKLDKIINNIIQKFILTKHKYFDNINKVNRHPGITTLKHIQLYEENNLNHEYDKLSGGNGAAMRSPIIGLIFRNDIDKLIEYSIKLSKITHNSVIGYLGAVTTAYFVSLAINDINIHKWPYLLIKLLTNDKIMNYINESKFNDDKNNIVSYDYDVYINNWKKYIELKFDDNKQPIKNRAHTNLIYRMQFYYENFVNNDIETMIGGSGYLVNIMAYDALLDCCGKWETLVIYSMLHLGDTDTVGCIAGAFYGALYGYGDVPKSNLKYLEFKDKLIELANKLYNKYK